MTGKSGGLLIYDSYKARQGANMLWTLLLLVIVIVVAGLLKSLKGRPRGNKGDDYPYTQIPVLFSPAERSFLGVLDQAVGAQYRIFGKVRVADVIQPRKGLDNGKYQTAFNRIRSKHFDFLLCARSDLSVLCAIELDDKSHKQRKRRKRDQFLSNACRASDLPLLQIPAQHGYTVHELRTKIYDSLESVTLKDAEPQSQGTAEGPTVVPFPTDPEFGVMTGSSVSDPSASDPQFGSILGTPAVASTKQSSRFDAMSKQTSARSNPDTERKGLDSKKPKNRPATVPSCPKCGAAMVRRRVKSGSKAGLVFWGCSTYPKCRGALREGSSRPVARTPSGAADANG